MKTMFRRFRKSAGVHLMIIAILVTMLAPVTTVQADSSVTLYKDHYEFVCATSGRPYIKIENTLPRNSLDIKMVDGNGRTVWQENNAIRAGQTYRTFYCGKNVNKIYMRVNRNNKNPRHSVVWRYGNKRHRR